jgi:hypothetical protein
MNFIFKKYPGVISILLIWLFLFKKVSELQDAK